MGYDPTTGRVWDDEETAQTTGYVSSEQTDWSQSKHDEDVETENVEDEPDDIEDERVDDVAEERKLTPTEKRLAAAKALLAELEAKAADERREKARKAAEAETKRDERLAASRGAALKQLYAAKGIEPIPGDRTEKERFAALLKALKVKV